MIALTMSGGPAEHPFGTPWSLGRFRGRLGRQGNTPPFSFTPKRHGTQKTGSTVPESLRWRGVAPDVIRQSQKGYERRLNWCSRRVYLTSNAAKGQRSWDRARVGHGISDWR